MDRKLLAWGRAAGARNRRFPPLWLFTDARRLPDPVAAVARLPKGLAGVVFRHDGHPDRVGLGRKLARICRSRRLTLVVAGDVRLAAALRAGVHLRAGRWPGAVRPRPGGTKSGRPGSEWPTMAGPRMAGPGSGRPELRRPGSRRMSKFITSSAHCAADLYRAARAGADLVFLSPVFTTPSHPDAAVLGPVRWSGLARAFPVAAAALGGVDGVTVRRLPGRLCRGVGAIAALS